MVPPSRPDLAPVPAGYIAEVNRFWPMLMSYAGREPAPEIVDVEHKGLVIPQAFTVSVLPDTLDEQSTWLVDLLFVVDKASERVRLAGVLSGRADTDQALKWVLAAQPLKKWVSWALTQLVQEKDPDADPDALRKRIADAMVGELVVRRRSAYTHERLRQVADLYRATKHNRLTVMAAELNLSVGSVSTLIRKARDAGYLAPAATGRKRRDLTQDKRPRPGGNQTGDSPNNE